MMAKTVIGENRGLADLKLFTINGNVQISAVYIENNSAILRLWNPTEDSQRIEILPNFSFTGVKKINLLGEEMESVARRDIFIFKPFEIITLKYDLPHRLRENLDSFRYVWSEYQKKRWNIDEDLPSKK